MSVVHLLCHASRNVHVNMESQDEQQEHIPVVWYRGIVRRAICRITAVTTHSVLDIFSPRYMGNRAHERVGIQMALV